MLLPLSQFGVEGGRRFFLKSRQEKSKLMLVAVLKCTSFQVKGYFIINNLITNIIIFSKS